MKFWTPKVHTEEKIWSVVLNPLRGELDKKRVAEKISEFFRLSYEEARELVESTPLILLDELSHESAQQLETIFQEIRAEVTLTSDPLTKRRCYRAVWPEAPDLSFLEKQTSEPPPEREMPLPEPAPEGPGVSREAQELLERRCRDLEHLCEEREREIEGLKNRLERELHGHTEKSNEAVRAIQQDWEERYQTLKEEYRESQAIYEEKILARERDFKTLEGRLNEMELWREKALSLEKQGRGLLDKVNHIETAKVLAEQAVKEQAEAVLLWREKYQSLAQKSERFEALYEEERKRREQTEETRRQAAELLDKQRQELENQSLETERWRRKFQELSEAQKRLEEEFSQFSSEQNAEAKRLREVNHELEIQLESAQRQARDLLARVEQQDLIERRTRLAGELSNKEARLRELAVETERIRQEIQDRELRMQTLGGEQAGLEREVLEVKQAQRHLLEQSKLKEKASKFRRPGKGIDSPSELTTSHD